MRFYNRPKDIEELRRIQRLTFGSYSNAPIPLLVTMNELKHGFLIICSMQ